MATSVPKIKVIVLYGGQSAEHEVSCRSAAFVLQNLDRDKYEINVIALDKGGLWIPQNATKLLAHVPRVIPIESAPPMSFKHLQLTEKSNASPQQTVVFPVLHGTNGEDGNLQGLLEMMQTAYVGPDTLGSAIGMDKIVAKKLASAAGVPVVPYVAIRSQEWENPTCRTQFLDQCVANLQYPMFVKPAHLGSSVGIAKVKSSREGLIQACQDALSFDDKILVEKGIPCRELEVAALGDYDPEISVVGEIVVKKGDFYDYTAKYIADDVADTVVPADITPAQSNMIREHARRAFVALELYGMARIDFFMDKTNGDIYLNEVNTIPGLTSISLYPMLWAASGVSASKLLDRLIELAIKRDVQRKSLRRDY